MIEHENAEDAERHKETGLLAALGELPLADRRLLESLTPEEMMHPDAWLRFIAAP